MDKQNLRRQRGFTLVEIMVVVVILGLLAGLVGPAVLGAFSDSQVEKARADLSSIHSAATRYVLKNQRIPEIEDLMEKDSNGQPWILGGEIPTDPWQNQYYIVRLEGRLNFAVTSWGPDALEGTDDDMMYPQQGDD